MIRADRDPGDTAPESPCGPDRKAPDATTDVEHMGPGREIQTTNQDLMGPDERLLVRSDVRLPDAPVPAARVARVLAVLRGDRRVMRRDPSTIHQRCRLP